MIWLLNFISSPGMWRGIVYWMMSAGIVLEPDEQNAIIAVGLALAGLIHAFSEGKKAKE